MLLEGSALSIRECRCFWADEMEVVVVFMRVASVLISRKVLPGVCSGVFFPLVFFSLFS